MHGLGISSIAATGATLPALAALGFLAVPGRVFLVQNVHEFSRIEDLSAHLALHKLDVLLAGDDANLRMFA
jgi:hypothetical protein